MKQNSAPKGPPVTPSVRELLVCPNCGRKTLSYEGTEMEFIYECLSPSCSYWSRKPRMQSNRGRNIFLLVISVLLVLLLACCGG